MQKRTWARKARRQPTVGSPALGRKLNPNPNQRGLSHPLRHAGSRATRRQHPTRLPDCENRSSSALCNTDGGLVYPKRTGAVPGGCSLPRVYAGSCLWARTSEEAPRGDGSRRPWLGPPSPNAWFPGKGAPLRWNPLDAVHRDLNSIPGKMIYYSEQQGKNNLNGGGDGQEGQKESSGESTPIATKTVSKKSWGIIPEDFTLDAEKEIFHCF